MKQKEKWARDFTIETLKKLVNGSDLNEDHKRIFLSGNSGQMFLAVWLSGFDRARERLYWKYKHSVRKTLDAKGQVNGHESTFDGNRILELGEEEVK